MRKKRFVRGSLRGKLLILSGAILMLAAAIFLQQREREKARAAYEETIQRESGEEDQEEGQEEEDRKETDTEEQSQDTEGTSGLWDNKAGEIPLIISETLENSHRPDGRGRRSVRTELGRMERKGTSGCGIGIHPECNDTGK